MEREAQPMLEMVNRMSLKFILNDSNILNPEKQSSVYLAYFKLCCQQLDQESVYNRFRGIADSHGIPIDFSEVEKVYRLLIQKMLEEQTLSSEIANGEQNAATQEAREQAALFELQSDSREFYSVDFDLRE